MKSYIIVSFLSLLVGAAATYKLIPPQVKVVTEVKTVVKTNTVTKYKKVIEPNGTVTVTVDRDKKTDSGTNAKSVPTQQNWNVTLYATSERLYGVGIQRKIIGDVHAYIGVQTNGQIQGGIGWSF